MIKRSPQNISLLNSFVTGHTEKVHETLVDSAFWKIHRSDIFFPIEEETDLETDLEYRKYIYQKCKTFLNHNKSISFYMYLLTDYDEEKDFLVTMRRQDFWAINLFVNSSTWLMESRNSYSPGIILYLVEYSKTNNKHLFDVWKKNNHLFTNLSKLKEKKRG